MNQKQTAKPRRKIAKPDPAHLDPDTTPVMKSGMVQALGIRVTSLSPKKVVGEMTITPMHMNASGATGAALEKRAFRSATERVETRLAYIEKGLQITSAQQTQWDSFANVLRKHARDIDERIQQRRAQAGQGAAPASVTAIERLERMQRMTAERYNRLGEVIAAAKPLYDVLSPEQKQAADQMLSRRGHGGHHRHHRPA